MRWVEEVVAELVRLRKAGMRTFDVAWSYAVDQFPPAQMSTGPLQLAFDQEESLVDFVKRRCRDEWEGRGDADYAADLRALTDTESDFAVVKRAVHSHRPRGGAVAA